MKAIIKAITEAMGARYHANGIEFAATYFIMLLALLVIGGGKYVSIDYWIAKNSEIN